MAGVPSSHRDGRARRVWPAWAALLLFALSLAAFWPGVAMYDTVRQYEQVLSGRYNDWHPPAMARLWSLLAPFAPGTGPMFALQIGLYWLGLGALAQALDDRKALALLSGGALPLFLGWQIVVLKDAQMAGALLCAAGLISTWRLSGKEPPAGALLGAAICLIYATLVRANAAFATVPLAAFMLAPHARPRVRIAAILIGIPAAFLAAQMAGQDLLGAQRTGVSRAEAAYDLAGIAVRTGGAGSISPAEAAALAAGHCVKPLFWDPLANRDDCAAHLPASFARPSTGLYVRLAQEALHHPIAYILHRAAHLNATWRWLVPRYWPLAAPPSVAEPNTIGLASPPCCAARLLQRLAGPLTETPLGWPILWIVVGLWGLAVTVAAPSGPARDLALALLLSSLCQEASFALLSISSDLRYHLWPMIAVGLGWVLLWQAKAPLRDARIAAAALGLVLLSGVAARLVLPVPPGDYQLLLR